MTGALTAIDIMGREGVVLRDLWKSCPKAYLGLMVRGFPNMFTVLGPQSPSVLSNNISQIELHVEWISHLLQNMREHNRDIVECDTQAQEDWVLTNNAIANFTVVGPQCNASNSYYRGGNIEGKGTDFVLPYVGGCLAYRAKLKEVSENNYAGFTLGKSK